MLIFLKVGVIMKSERVEKCIFQSELTAQKDISKRTLNNLNNKKIDINDLQKIAEILDISLQTLLKAETDDLVSPIFTRK